MRRRKNLVFITISALLVAGSTSAASYQISTTFIFNLHEESPSATAPLRPAHAVVLPENPRISAAGSEPATTTPHSAIAPRRIQSGVQMGWQASDITEFEAKTGISVDLVGEHIQWGNERDFPSYLGEAVRDAAKTLVVFWNPMDYTKPIDRQQDYSYGTIIFGDWDSYLSSFAQQARDYGGPVILIPLEEPNGNWDAWSGSLKGNSPELYVETYRHIQAFFDNVPNVYFGWAVNYESLPDTPENQLERYYPGDAYVDYVGVDGFNFGDPWLSFDDIFAAPLARLARYKKPIYIFSIASARGKEKPQWIENFLTSPLLRQYDVQGWLWFNENKEEDWRVWSSPAALEAFRTYAGRE